MSLCRGESTPTISQEAAIYLFKQLSLEKNRTLSDIHQMKCYDSDKVGDTNCGFLPIGMCVCTCVFAHVCASSHAQTR